MAKSSYLSELFLRWVVGQPFPAPAAALYLGLHTSNPDTAVVGELDPWGIRQRRLLEPAMFGVQQTGERIWRLTNTTTLELGEVRKEARGVLFLGVWDHRDIGQGNLLFYSQLPQSRDLLVGDRLLVPAQAFVMEEV